MRLRYVPQLLIAAAALLFAAVQAFARGIAEEAPDSERLRVVATHSILGDFVANVAGDALELSLLAGANQDPHVYEPAPADSRALLEADIVFENGLLLKGWLDPLYAQSGSSATRVVVTHGVRLLEYDDEHGHDEHGHDEHGHDDEHLHGDYDPHVWQSVANAIVMAENIRDALVDADPANAELYTWNAASYIAELEQLDRYILDLAETIPPDRRLLVTGHEAFAYFADRYGFRIVGAALGAVTTEGADPSAGEIAALIDDIRKAGSPVVFAESIVNPHLARRVAEEAGARFVAPIYSDALDEPGTAAGTYIGMMRHNIETMVDALAE